MGDFQGRHALIFAAAPEEHYEYIRQHLDMHPDTVIACADGGVRHARAMGLTPQLVIGDFDSGDTVSACEGTEYIRLCPEKDDTDTQSVMRELLRRGCRDMLLVCATGGRLDHLLGNLSLLEEAAGQGIALALMDRQNYVVMHQGGMQQFTMPDAYQYFSLIPLDAVLTGVTITGAKYPLENAKLYRSAMISISNQATDAHFTITVRQGRALVIFSKDICR